MRREGFTLLEMIVVLAILGLATALIAPSMLRGIDTWRRKAAMDVLLDQVRALPGNARAAGKPIVIDTDALASADSPLRIDGDWTLSNDKPWRVSANGVCESGELKVSNRYGEKTIRVAAPFCDPDIVP